MAKSYSAELRAERRKHLDSIEKLLKATYDLMKAEPSLDQAAFEHLRQLRVKVRYAISAALPVKPDDLPTVAPLKWQHRSELGLGTDLSPLDFTSRIYGRWLHNKNNISRADIRRIDKQLYMAYYSHKITSEQLDAIGLLTRAALNTKKLESIGQLKRPKQSADVLGISPEDEERTRLWMVARRRRQRALKRQR